MAAHSRAPSAVSVASSSAASLSGAAAPSTASGSISSSASSAASASASAASASGSGGAGSVGGGVVSSKLTPEEEKEFREIFNLVDKDKGGSISKKELSSLMTTLGINADEVGAV
jgi:hypothetical protein